MKRLRYGKQKNFDSGVRKVQLQSLDLIGSNIDNDVITGVSVIQMGEARGHNIFIDETTLEQVMACGNKARDGVKVKLDHQGGTKDIVGRVKNFRIQGDKVLADLHLLKSHPLKDYVLELATEMASECGLSVSMSGKDDVVDDKVRARCEDLSAVDLVCEPAANATGLFEENQQVDANAPDKDYFDIMTKEELQALMSEALTPITTELAELKKNFEEASKTEATASTAATATLEKDKDEADKDMAAKVVAELAKMFSTAGGKTPAASPAVKTEEKVTPKTFEQLVTDLKASGKKLSEAINGAMKDEAAYSNYLERCAKDSEGLSRSKSLGVPHKSLVDYKALSN